MMAILGFAFACGLLLYFSFMWLFAAFFTLGKYNIGGVENTFTEKLIVCVCFLILLSMWKLTFENAPFSITVG